jgi:hypothetical protein
MKAVKRFFKRKKQQPREAGSLGDRAGAAPSRPILKSTPPNHAPGSAPDQTRESSGALTARASGMSSPSPAVKQRKTASPAVVPKPATRQPAPPKHLSSEDTEKRSNGSNSNKSSASKSSTQTIPSVKDAPENTSGSSKEEEKGTYKGVSDSFKKGLSATQRFGVGESTEEQPSTDPNHFGKIGDAYDSIPLLEQTKLPRGGLSMETKAVGRVQVSRCRARCWKRIPSPPALLFIEIAPN